MSELQQLFEASRAGDRNAFDRLFDNLSPRLRGVAETQLGKQLRQRVEVDDVIQEASMKAFQALESIEWKGEKALFSWFCRIITNVIYTYSRRYAKLQHAPPDIEQSDAITSPSRHVQRQERFERLEEALAKLTPDQQQVIRLTWLEGLPVREAAVRMDKNVKTTSQLLWRATSKLKEVFGDTKSFRLPADRNLGGTARRSST